MDEEELLAGLERKPKRLEIEDYLEIIIWDLESIEKQLTRYKYRIKRPWWSRARAARRDPELRRVSMALCTAKNALAHARGQECQPASYSHFRPLD